MRWVDNTARDATTISPHVACGARLRRLAWLGILPLLAAVTGCQDPHTPLVPLPEPTLQTQINIYQLADRLGLDVRQVTPSRAVLTNRANSVVLLLGKRGRAYVNGKLAPGSEGLYEYMGMVWVPSGLGDTLRRCLAPLPRIVPHWEIPRPPIQQPPFGSGRGIHVVVDAGHGGSDPGAISVHGASEKSVNLAVARAVASRLRAAGATVTLTRQGDTFIGLDERAAIANRVSPHLFVSIHADSARSRSARGCTVYTCRQAGSDSTRAATTVLQAMTRSGRTGRGVRQAGYRVLTQTQCPAILIELGYLSNPTEARQLAEGGTQEQLAAAISEGILAYGRTSASR